MDEYVKNELQKNYVDSDAFRVAKKVGCDVIKSKNKNLPSFLEEEFKC
jgi:hypothetical protein